MDHGARGSAVRVQEILGGGRQSRLDHLSHARNNWSVLAGPVNIEVIFVRLTLSHRTSEAGYIYQSHDDYVRLSTNTIGSNSK
jgi:hypothetical protein